MADGGAHPLLEVTDLRKSYGDRVVLGGRCVTVIEGAFLLP